MNINLGLIKDLRRKNKITLLEMSEALGFKNASTYLKYEKGIYKFRANMLPTIAEKLNCQIDIFFDN